jgi:hypothetical protein
MNDEIDVTVQRPFKMVTIKPEGRGRPRNALRLNVDRVVRGRRYTLLLIPYSKEEAIGARKGRTVAIAPYMPDEPNVEGVDYNARPARMVWPKSGHLQFVRAERVSDAKETRQWAA